MDDVIPYTVNLRKNPPVYLPFYGLRHGGRTSFESCRSTGNGIPGHRAVSPCFPCLLRLEELISFPIPSTGLPLYGLSYCGQTRCELCPWTENGISRLAGTLWRADFVCYTSRLCAVNWQKIRRIDGFFRYLYVLRTRLDLSWQKTAVNCAIIHNPVVYTRTLRSSISWPRRKLCRDAARVSGRNVITHVSRLLVEPQACCWRETCRGSCGICYKVPGSR